MRKRHFSPALSLPTLVLVLGLVLPCRLSSSPLGLNACLGAEIGLDRAARGAGLEAGLAIQPRDLGAELRVEARYDASLSSFFAGSAFRLLFGPDLALGFGIELPLGSPSLLEPRSGARVYLEPAFLLSSFSLDAVLLEFQAAGKGRPRVFLSASLRWAAFRVSSILSGEVDAGPLSLEEELAGILGFEAGFRALLALGLSWGPS